MYLSQSHESRTGGRRGEPSFGSSWERCRESRVLPFGSVPWDRSEHQFKVAWAKGGIISLSHAGPGFSHRCFNVREQPRWWITLSGVAGDLRDQLAFAAHALLTQQHQLTRVHRSGHAWPFLMVRASEVPLNFHQTTLRRCYLYLSKGELAYPWQVRFSGVTGREKWELVFKCKLALVFVLPDIPGFRGIRRLICLEMVLSMTRGLHHLPVNLYFNCSGLCHYPHSPWMITAALSEAVPSPLCLSSF